MDVVKEADLSGKIVVVAGAISTGEVLIDMARYVDRVKESLQGIPNTSVEYVDLLNPASIHAFAE